MATTSPRRRMLPKERKVEIMDAALVLAAKHGITNITRDQIAKAADASPSLVTARLGTMEKLRAAVMKEAVKRELIVVVAQGLAMKDKAALKAPDELKQRAIAHLSAL